MNTYTPGPWILKHKGGNNLAVQSFEFLSKDSYPIFQKDCTAIDGAIVYCSPQDAALIAFAPELAELVHMLLCLLDIEKFPVSFYTAHAILEKCGYVRVETTPAVCNDI